MDSTSELIRTTSSDTCDESTLPFKACYSPPIYSAHTGNSSHTETTGQEAKEYKSFLTFVEVLSEIPDSRMDVLGVQQNDLVVDCQVAGQQCSQW